MSFAKRKAAAFFGLFAFLSFFSAESFAFSGLLGVGKIRVSETSYFDIIYTQKSEQTAKLLYERADLICEEVSELYGVQPSFHIPVVIIPSVESLNAFFSPFPYNHIVVYDTSNSSLDELSYFSESLISIFRHELTHAVSYNVKNSFWKGVGKIFGDVADLGYISISSGIAESAAVTSESLAGEGRLNDEFARHNVKQAKIENKFPKFYDVQGSRDIYAANSFYHFNSAFAQWLQQKYGMESYATFWYKLVNFQKLTTGSAFKYAFGISLNKAWKQFINEYEIPDVLVLDSEHNLIKEKAFSSDTRLLYDSLVSSDNKLFWLEASSGKIQYAEIPSSSPKTFLTVINAQNLGISKDGKYLAVTWFSQNSKTLRSKVSIYDTSKKNHITIKNHGLKNASIIQSRNEYFVVCQNYFSPYNVIEIYKIIFSSSGKLKSAEKVQEIKLAMNVFAASFTQYEDECFAFIKKDGIDYSICIMDISGTLLEEYKMPYDDMILSNLSVSAEKEILFNYVQKGTMPRLGKISKESVELFSQDLSGGIFYPNLINEEIYYIGKFYEHNRIMHFGINEFSKGNIAIEKNILNGAAENMAGGGNITGNSENIGGGEIIPGGGETITGGENIGEENIPGAGDDILSAGENLFARDNISTADIPSKAFNPFKYYAKGVFIPLSIYKSSSFGINYGSSYFTQYFPLGMTYITGMPWTNSNNSLAMFTAGYGFFSNAFGVDLLLKSSTETQLFSCSSEFLFEADRYGPKQAGTILQASSIIPAGRISHFSFNNSFSAFYGKQDNFIYLLYPFLKPKSQTLFGLTTPLNGICYSQFSDVFSISYSNIHKTGSGRFDKLGFSLNAGVGYIFSQQLKDEITLFNEFVLSPSVNISLPALIPVTNCCGLIYNLPLSLYAGLFPSNSRYAGSVFSYTKLGNAVLDFDAQVVLFGFEVQKAIPFIPALYINNLYLTAGYNSTIASFLNTKSGFQFQHLGDYFSGLENNTTLYLDSVYLMLNMGFTPNYGVLANKSLKMDAYGKLNLMIRKFRLQKSAITLDMGIKANF